MSTHVKHSRTPARRAEEKALREQFQRRRPTMKQLLASGDYDGPFNHGQFVGMRVALAALKDAREKAGLSLSEVARRSGIDKGALSRLESGRQSNPTLDTLCRYADALGKILTFGLSDAVQTDKIRGR